MDYCREVRRNIAEGIIKIKVMLDPELRRFMREFETEIDEWFCESRNIPMSANKYKSYLAVVVYHLDRNYSDVRNQSAWYVWHYCNRVGILKNGMPVRGCKRVDAEEKRLKELYRLGGREAVKAYMDIFRE